MDREVAKAINDLSKRMNEMENKLEKFLLEKHEDNKGNIDAIIEGVDDIASTIVSMQSTEEEV